jgi:chromosome segregation ATPase
MTKRYLRVLLTGDIKDTVTGELIRGSGIGDLLNELHEQLETCKDANTRCCNEYSAMRRDVLRYKEENEQLKHKLQQQEMEYATDLHRLAEENEQLRTKNNAYIQDIEVFKEENTHLKLENEQLKSDLQYWAKTAEARLKKIEQLKTTIQQLRTDNTKQKKLLNTTMKQNKHTATTIKTMMDTERTELGKSVLKQLWEAIQ